MHHTGNVLRLVFDFVLLAAQSCKELHHRLLRWAFKVAPGDVFGLGQEFFGFGHFGHQLGSDYGSSIRRRS
jgi:hypothetical protein